jgi:ABC-type oligopeptide transport system substrate-binding subunit
MKRKSGKLLLIVASVTFLAIGLAGCGGSDSQAATSSTDTSKVNGPAPDNNSANNPSLADTNYEKNRTRPITDTMRQDSGKAR